MPIPGGPAVRIAKAAASCAAMAALVLTTRVARAEGDDVPPAKPAPAVHPANAFELSLGAGFAAQKLYGVSMDGVGLEALIGGNVQNITIAADVEEIGGSTEYGLKTNTFSIGLLLEGDFDRFRVGGGARLGLFSVDRATMGSNLDGSTVGIFVRLSFDVYQFNEGRGAIYLAAKGSVDSVGGSLVGGVFGAGVRL